VLFGCELSFLKLAPRLEMGYIRGGCRVIRRVLQVLEPYTVHSKWLMEPAPAVPLIPKIIRMVFIFRIRTEGRQELLITTRAPSFPSTPFSLALGLRSRPFFRARNPSIPLGRFSRSSPLPLLLSPLLTAN
jgi:hypothetical protein